MTAKTLDELLTTIHVLKRVSAQKRKDIEGILETAQRARIDYYNALLVAKADMQKVHIEWEEWLHELETAIERFKAERVEKGSA